MSDQDDALLDEDLGDDEYDLGNDEEEALLADDYEIDRQNSYKGEEETDDVLDLGVTDALDDLEGEDENIDYRSDTDNHNRNEFYKEEHADNHGGGYYQQEDHRQDIRKEQYETSGISNETCIPNSFNTGDLREKLQKNVQRKVYIGNGQGLEDDDCEEAEERRNRFHNERIMIPHKMNSEIPDSLENVVTVDEIRQQQASFRGRGRGRGIRGIRGGRFVIPNVQRDFIPCFYPNPMRNQMGFKEQKVFRSPLIEGRPPMYPRILPNNMMNQQQQQQHHQQQQQQQQQQQMMYQNASQPAPYLQNVPSQPATPHFAEPRGVYNPNHFGNPTDRGRPIPGPRMEFRAREPILGFQMPRYNVPPGGMQTPYMQNEAQQQQQQQQHFQSPMIPGSQGPSILGIPGLPSPGPQISQGISHGNPAGQQLIPINQGANPVQENSGNLEMLNFPRIPVAHQGQPVPNHSQISARTPFDNRQGFQDHSFQGRRIYDSRPIYNNQHQVQQQQPPPPPPQPQQQQQQQAPPPSTLNQINNAPPIVVPPSQTATPHVPNMPLPPGHKILINPHFRGAVQPTTDARLAWDSQQQQQQQQPSQHQPTIPGGTYPSTSAAYPNREVYSQPTASSPQTCQESQRNYQPVKSDDPYAYFSDVWQENKTQKLQTSAKSYPPENSYSRDSSYSSYGNKCVKSDNNWGEHRDSHHEEHGLNQNYRGREPPTRSRSENVPRQRVSASNHIYRGETYDQKPSNKVTNVSGRLVGRAPLKRSPEAHDRLQRDAASPKKLKTVSNKQVQQPRNISAKENVASKKEDDGDPEMKEYREKMEEQKRLREKILQEKENRRKQAALEKLGDDLRGDSRTTEVDQQLETNSDPVAVGVTKDNAHPAFPARGRNRPANAQTTEVAEKNSGVRVVTGIQSASLAKTAFEIVPGEDASDASCVQSNARQLVTQGTRRVVIHKPLPNTQWVVTNTKKTVSKLQRTQQVVKSRVPQKVGQHSTGILKNVKVGTGQKIVINAHRSIVAGSTGNLRSKDVVLGNAQQKIVINTQNNQRLVLQKSAVASQFKQRATPEIKTNTVRIDNLAASTSETQIRRMCQGIGTLESIQMGEGNATVVFTTQSAALVFHKKYQRKMLDLSLINVQLVPQNSTN